LNVLFICGRNRRRSPTAEVVIGRLDGVSADSAGVRKDSEVVVSRDQVEWADLVVLMENRYRKPLRDVVGGAVLRNKRVVSVDIADDYEVMDDALIALLLQRVPPLLH